MSAHPNAIRTYVLVYFALMVLLVVTVAIAFVDLGILNLPVAMFVATVKATLVVWYFMHCDNASPMIRFCVWGSLVGLFLAFLFTFSDYLTRGQAMLELAR